ncbi:MAG: translation initiation factor IF-6, partial [Thermoplasmata archaeon]|nr:translation initiation factor IF-6 [Thermoplasmata archaeon]
MIRKAVIYGNPMVGVFSVSTEKTVFLPEGMDEGAAKVFSEALGVEVCRVTIDGSPLLGSLMVANSRGIMVPDFTADGEVDILSSWGRVERVPETLNALGNNILANDHAALVHPQMADETLEVLASVLGVSVERGTVGDMETVGSAAVATSRGVMCHPRLSDAEREVLRRLYDLPVYIGTVNYGSSLVGAGMVANSRGGVVGEPTTGV